MNRYTVPLRYAFVTALLVRVLIDPSTPAVLALAVVVVLAIALAVVDYIASRDERLDKESRVAALRAAAVVDELVRRLQKLEEWQGVVRHQSTTGSHGPLTWGGRPPTMNGGP